MFFTVESSVIDKYKSNIWILKGARLTIDLFQITPAQKALNSFLWKNYGLNIKAASTLVIANCRLQKNRNSEIIVTFPSKKIDNLAALITYGNGKIQGCSILQEAFGKIER